MFSKAKRSEVMAKIKSKNTSLDLAMKSLLRKARLRFEMYPRILGTPDFLVEDVVAVFCDSSFWHGRNWTKLRSRLLAGNNPTYWVQHILSNKRRDKRISRGLVRSGYAVVRLWDTEVFRNPANCLDKIRESLS
jgi:DNA mismatch endonuclease (patch repair protein)